MLGRRCREDDSGTGGESRLIRVENSVASSLPPSGHRLCFSQLCSGSERLAERVWAGLSTLLEPHAAFPSHLLRLFVPMAATSANQFFCSA